MGAARARHAMCESAFKLPRIQVRQINFYFKNSTLMVQLQNTVCCSQYSKQVPNFINETLKHKFWKYF